MKQNTHFMAHQHQPSAQLVDQMPSQIRSPYRSQRRDSDYKDDPQSQNLPASKTCVYDKAKMALPEPVSASATDVTRESGEAEESGREKLKRHRVEMAGRVWIPEIWGQEELLKDWIDCSAFDAPLVPSRIMTARAALVQESTRANAGGLRIENRC